MKALDEDLLVASELVGGAGAEEVYLDAAGAALPPLSLLRAVAEDLLTQQQREGNPHTRGEQKLDEARALILDLFSASPDVYSVVFTSGATQSLKIVAESFTFGEAGCLYHPLAVHTSVLGMRSFAPRVASFPTAKLFSPAPASAARSEDTVSGSSSSLIVIPGECNFNGSKIPLDEASRWVQHLGESEEELAALGGGNGGRLYWLLDAAKLAATSPVRLASLPAARQPDFVVASFYKIFGYPTGLGVLLVKRTAAPVLGSRLYYGGGTILATSADREGRGWVVPRPDQSDRLQDGTPHFQGIASLRRGFEAVGRLGGMKAIQLHASRLARRLAHALAALKHPSSSSPVCRVLGRHFEGPGVDEKGGDEGGGEEGEEGEEEQYMRRQGPIVAFCVFWADGSPVGHSEVLRLAQVEGIFLRAGCCCNPGACQEALGLTHDDVKNNLLLGRTCAGEDSAGDVVNGRHTGVVRASLGWSSRESDCLRLVDFLLKFFVGGGCVGDPLLSRRLSLLTCSPASAPSMEVGPELGLGCVLSEVSLYPIKSCGVVRAARWALTPSGLLLDREWVIVDSAGKALTQKTHPTLSLVRPFVDVARGVLVVSAPGLDTTELLLPTDDEKVAASLRGCIALDSPPPRPRPHPSSSTCSPSPSPGSGPSAGTGAGAATFSNVRVCGLRRPAHQEESELLASQWFSSYLGTPCFVMRRQRQKQRQEQSAVAGEGEGEKTFSNEAPLLVVNESSVAMHLSHMGGAGSNTTVNFRPNFVLRGCEPFCEDKWASIDVGSITFTVAGPCQRCSVINVNGSTGAVDGRALASLAEFRRSRGKGGAIHFGLFLNLSLALRERLGKGEIVFISRFSTYSSSVHE